MIWFFIIASFLLHVVAIFGFVILSQRISFYQSSISQMKEELEATYESMEMFVSEIEKGNETLYKKFIHATEKAASNRVKSQKEKIQINSAAPTFEKAETVPTSTQMEEVGEVMVDSKKIVPLRNQETTFSNNEKYKKIEQLVKQGHTEEHITKLLKCGKGEVQLIANLVKKTSEV
jgi:hypothetical protein